MIFKDYYKILGLDTCKVSADEIKIAYREQAKKYHPDVNVGNSNAEERFKDINEAYKVLSDSVSKRKYDRMWNSNIGKKKIRSQEATRETSSVFSDFFHMFFGADNNKLENNNQSTNTTKKVQQTKNKTVNEEKQQPKKSTKKQHTTKEEDNYYDENGQYVGPKHSSMDDRKNSICDNCKHPIDDCICDFEKENAGEYVDYNDYETPEEFQEQPKQEKKQQEQEETPAQQDNNQSQQYNSKDDEEILK